MNCIYVQRNMPEYLAGSLKNTQLQRFERHLQQCQSCREDLELMKPVVPEMHSPVKISVSYSLQLQLKQMTEQEPIPRSLKARILNMRWVKIVYCLIASFLLVIWGGRLFDWFVIQHFLAFILVGLFCLLISTVLLILLNERTTGLENGGEL